MGGISVVEAAEHGIAVSSRGDVQVVFQKSTKAHSRGISLIRVVPPTASRPRRISGAYKCEPTSY
jgi:hypothetical protein